MIISLRCRLCFKHGRYIVNNLIHLVHISTHLYQILLLVYVQFTYVFLTISIGLCIKGQCGELLLAAMAQIQGMGHSTSYETRPYGLSCSSAHFILLSIWS